MHTLYLHVLPVPRLGPFVWGPGHSDWVAATIVHGPCIRGARGAVLDGPECHCRAQAVLHGHRFILQEPRSPPPHQAGLPKRRPRGPRPQSGIRDARITPNRREGSPVNASTD